MEALKKYTFQNKEFEAKKITLELMTETFQLKKNWERHLEKMTNKSWKDINKVITKIKSSTIKNEKTENFINTILSLLENEKTDEAFKLLNTYDDEKDKYINELKEKLVDLTLAFSDAVELFLLNEQNLKELFAGVLNGDVNSIDYSIDDKEKEANLKLFSITVFNDFFLTSKKVTKKQE